MPTTQANCSILTRSQKTSPLRNDSIKHAIEKESSPEQTLSTIVFALPIPPSTYVLLRVLRVCTGVRSNLRVYQNRDSTPVRKTFATVMIEQILVQQHSTA